MEAHRNADKKLIILIILPPCVFAAYFAVALRLYARYKRGVHFGADDWWIVVAMVKLLIPNRKPPANEATVDQHHSIYHCAWVHDKIWDGSSYHFLDEY